MTKRLPVLDFLRGIAILCVVIDHVFAWLQLGPQYDFWRQFTIFSVAPLFFLAGVTYGLSWLKRPLALPNWKELTGKELINFLSQYAKLWWQKSQKLIIAYVIGILVILVWTTQSFSLKQFLYNLVTFPNQFYFISIYAQLMLVAPLLMWLWQKTRDKKWWLLAAVGGLLLVAIGLNQFTEIGKVIYEPARKLLGGIEVFVFGLGTLLAVIYSQTVFISKMPKKAALMAFGGVILAFLVVSGGINKIFAHPPNFWTLIYAAGIMLLLTGIFNWLQSRKWVFLTKWISFLGRHSLDIYIYHGLLIGRILLRVPSNWWGEWLITKFIVLTLVSSLLSIVITVIVDKVLWWVSKWFQTAKI